MRSKTRVSIIVFIIVLLALLIIARVSGYFTNQKIVREKAIAVTVGTVEKKTLTLSLQAMGTVQAYSTVAVKSLVDGELLKVGFHEGDFVKKGQLLFVIDPRPFEAQLAQAQANLARDAAQLNNARLQVNRNAVLAKKGYIAAQDFDQLQANEKALIGTVAADKAAVNTAKLQLNYATIVSPIAGRTGSIQVDQGNIITAASGTALVTITQINPILIAFSVPQQYLTAIQTEQSIAPIAVKATLPNDEETGQLSFIDNTVDVTTGSIQLRATFSNPNQRLWPGQYVPVILPTTTLKNAIVIPSSAVQIGQQGAYVFLVKPNKTVSYHPVKLGSIAGNETVILDGLQAGEKVVTDGQLRLNNGSEINIVAAPG